MATGHRNFYFLSRRARLIAVALLITGYVQSASADFGFEYVDDTTGVLFHTEDQAWTGSWSYLCVDQTCYAAVNNNGRYEYTLSNLTLDTAYAVEFKVQDDSTGQFITTGTMTFSSTSSSSGSTQTDTATDAATSSQTDTETDTTTETASSGSGTASGSVDFGIEQASATSGIIFRVDEGFRGDFAYLCLESDCREATLTNGRWERSADNLVVGQAYLIKTQIDNDPQILDELTWTFGESASGEESTEVEPEDDTGSDAETETETDTSTETETETSTSTNTDTDTESDTGTSNNTESGVQPGAPADYSLILFDGESDEYTVFQDVGDKIVTTFAGRGHRRHEPSGIDGMDPNNNPANPNHFNFHFEYWQDRIYNITIDDYVAHGESRIVFTLDMLGAHAANSSNAGSNIPYVKCGKDFGNETGYYESPPPVELGNNQYQYTFTVNKMDMDDQPGYNYETDPDEQRPFAVGDLLECEVTIRWQAIVDAGETDEANYYGQIWRYRVGQGGFVGFNRDPNVGVYVNSENSLLGGYTTYHPLGYNERPRSYMQLTPNMQPENIEDFLVGRRIFRTSFVDGSHWDPSNSSNGFNPGMPELAKDLSNFDDRCSDCHLDDGNGTHLQTAADKQTPRIIGMGLLEAIPEELIASWADPDDADNDGISGRMNIVNGGYVGRFGYSATQHSVEAQVLAALEGEMSVTSADISNEHLTQLVRYMQLLAVPAARTPDLLQHEGWDEFNDFGCADCHKTEAQTGAHPLVELRNQTIRPFTDLLLHDLGQGEIRTTPLWGIGLAGAVRSVAKDHEGVAPASAVNMANNTAQADLMNNRDDNDFMIWSDGTCIGAEAFDCAIRKHGGEGSFSSGEYINASEERKADLIQLLRDI